MTRVSFLFRFCSLVIVMLIAASAAANSYDNQQKIAPFDGFIGEQGEFSLVSPAISTWKSDSSIEPMSSLSATSGFAFRKFAGDFILTVQLKPQAESKFCFGVKVEAETNTENSFALKTKLDLQGNIVVENLIGKKTILPVLALVKNPDIFQVERKDNEIIISVANFGKPLKVIGRQVISKNQTINAGIYRAFSSNDKNILELRNLRWVIPAAKDLIPYHDYLGSRLELLDTVTGERNVIYETSAAIEAPNWTSDGDNIIYNAFGHVYKFHLPSKKITLINTGFETRNNNDHVVSYKGKILGITHRENGVKNKWTIYKLPIAGGEPQQLTVKTPSFLHGWSPDGRYIIYTGEREGQYDIYRMASDGTGDEIRLTDTKGWNDGSEYSPDGKYIYFNSSRTGAMRLWRMDADGKHPKQITDDNFNDWFPHVSPDGSQILFISYLPDVAPDQHPYYQQVYLRSMPVKGGEPKVVAYLYGGQGTINVPSWSPDGRYVAFVSNSQFGVIANPK